MIAQLKVRGLRNDDSLLKNLEFRLKNDDFLLKTVDFIIKQAEANWKIAKTETGRRDDLSRGVAEPKLVAVRLLNAKMMTF